MLIPQQVPMVQPSSSPGENPPRARALPRALSLSLAVAAALAAPALGGCRSGRLPSEAAGTTVQAGESLHGRVHEQNAETQCFTFEGVESSLLDFTLVSDNGSLGAPVPSVTDPDGKPLDISPFVASPEGAATMRVQGVPLRRTGIYRATVANTIPGFPVYYRFSYQLVFPPIQDLRMTLRPEQATPIYVSAPRGGQVVVRVQPRGAGLVPDLQGVQDPWGGRALDATQVPQGKPCPQASRLADGTLLLCFHAPRPGVYTVLAAAKPGTAGDASVFAEVKGGGNPGAHVWHTNGPCTGYGMPGEAVSSFGGARGADPALASR